MVVEVVDRVAERDVEYVTTIRGREVSCRVEDGRLVGDAELMARIARSGQLIDVDDPVALIHLLVGAVGSDVTIRLPSDTQS